MVPDAVKIAQKVSRYCYTFVKSHKKWSFFCSSYNSSSHTMLEFLILNVADNLHWCLDFLKTQFKREGNSYVIALFIEPIHLLSYKMLTIYIYKERIFLKENTKILLSNILCIIEIT
jgi:hypothetical protein